MKTTLEIRRTQGERRRDALIAAGIAPSGFGQRKASRPHRDRKKALLRGEHKHKRDWI